MSETTALIKDMSMSLCCSKINLKAKSTLGLNIVMGSSVTQGEGSAQESRVGVTAV